MFGFFKKKKPVEEELVFENLPDDKYLVKYVDEKDSHNEFILVILEITRGEHKSKHLPVKFDNSKAKKITRENSGLWLSRLVFEEDKKAYDLEAAMETAKSESDDEFIVNVKNGFVNSIPEHDFEKVERFIKKLNTQKA